MPNISPIINSHNKKIINPHAETKMCNCIQKDLCPLNQNCLTSNIIYEATLSSNLRNQLKNKYIHAKPPSKPDTLTIRSHSTPKNTKIALPILKNSGALKN